MQLSSQNIDCLHTGKLEISFLLIRPRFLAGCVTGQEVWVSREHRGGLLAGTAKRRGSRLCGMQNHSSGSWLFSEWKEQGRGMVALEPAERERESATCLSTALLSGPGSR